MSSNIKTRMAAGESAALSHRLAAAALGGLLGLFMIYGVGFAHPEAIHNAAHDTRHAATFPCH